MASRLLSPGAAPFLAIVLTNSPAWAVDFTVTDCSSDVQLRGLVIGAQAIDHGRVLFDCGTATIMISEEIVVQANEVTVDGGNKITLSGADKTRIFFVKDSGDLTLSNIVLTNGASPTDGGAVYVQSHLSLNGTTVQNSKAAANGGAIAVSGGQMSTSECVLAHNEAVDGGAVAGLPGATDVYIDTTEIFDNHASERGGGVFLLSSSDFNYLYADVHDNTAKEGGALYAAQVNGFVRVGHSNLHDNTASDRGGGVYNHTGGLLVDYSILSGNDADFRGGGGLYLELSEDVSIENSTVAGNTAIGGGAGLLISGSSQTNVTNSTFSANDGGPGAGIYNFESSTVLRNLTITGSIGGGLSNSTGSGDALLVGNTIVANSTGQPNCSDDGTETYVSMSGNLSDDASCVSFLSQAGDKHNANEALGPLGMHGGETPTHVPEPDSDAIDAAIDPGVKLPDQRDVARPQGAAWDVGAVEVVECGAVLCGDANRTSSLTASDALAALRTAVGSESCPEWRCDYDGSGAIAASDALAILRASVGQPTNPSCPDPWDCIEDLDGG